MGKCAYNASLSFPRWTYANANVVTVAVQLNSMIHPVLGQPNDLNAKATTKYSCSISHGCQGGCTHDSSQLTTKQVNGIIGGALGLVGLCAILTTLVCWRRRRRAPITIHNYIFPTGGVGSWLRNFGPNRTQLGGGLGIGPQYGPPNSAGYVESEAGDINAGPGRQATKSCAYQNHQLPASEFDARAPTARCNHGAEDCKGCLTIHLEQLLNEGVRWNQITCPRCLENSRQVLSYDDVMRFAITNPAVAERYDNSEHRVLMLKSNASRFLVQRRRDIGAEPNATFRQAYYAPSTAADSGIFSQADGD